jgi:hypothetical protein
MLDFVRTLARREYVFLWGDKRFLKLQTNKQTNKQSHIDTGAESVKELSGLETLLSASFFSLLCTSMYRKYTIFLNILLVAIQEFTLQRRGFLCKIRVVQAPKKLFAYYANRTMIIIIMEITNCSPS